MIISPIPIFRDNYVWLLAIGQKAIVVDPGDAEPVLERLHAEGLELYEIWVTHHHPDHVAGIPKLLEEYPKTPLRTPKGSPLPYEHIEHDDGDEFPLFGPETVGIDGRPMGTVRVMFVPGHTADHIAFLLLRENSAPALFCGDTLFAAGCGRLLGGTAEQLYQSLKCIAELPPQTLIYCTHEYTESNLRFALAVDPNNEALLDRTKKVHSLRIQGIPSIPSTLEIELATNPFLRTDSPAVCDAILNRFMKKVAYPNEIFKDLRAWKDSF